MGDRPSRSIVPSAVGNWVQQWRDTLLSDLSIRHKIILGYSISLGIAVLGTSTGLLVGNIYQHKAREAQQTAQYQAQLLSRLQVTLSQFRPEHEFLPVLSDESRLQRARTLFFQRLAQVDALLGQIRDSLDPQEMGQMAGYLNAFETEINRYRESLNAILKNVDPATIDAATVDQIEQDMAAFVDGPTNLRLFRYSDELTVFVEQAEANRAQANAALDRAETLRTRLIVGSMVLSMAIASLLAIYTSHAITRPIKTVTRVAEQVTAEDNFNLRAPVTTHDEIGRLAISLNQLIQRIAEYTRELQDAQAQLIQTEKMSSLGQMVAGVAHEINNPVNFIYGNLSHTRDYTEKLLHLIATYQAEYPDPSDTILDEIEEIDLEFLQEDTPKLLASMKIGADRIRQIVLSLRNFSRLDEADMKAVDLYEGLESTLLLLSNRLKRNITIRKDYANLSLVQCYPAQINQVFMNILSNAIDALMEQSDSDKKMITIKTEEVTAEALKTDSGEEIAADLNLEKARSPYAVIHIQDNGPGIPPEVINRLFDPFFTTKPVGKGTGLGLAIAYQIIQKHHGIITINSQPNRGTTFSIFLPIQQTPEIHSAPLVTQT